MTPHSVLQQYCFTYNNVAIFRVLATIVTLSDAGGQVECAGVKNPILQKISVGQYCFLSDDMYSKKILPSEILLQFWKKNKAKKLTILFKSKL